MNQVLACGENIVLESLQGRVVVTHENSSEIDTSLTAFLLTDSGKVAGDDGLVFYNQPTGPNGMSRYFPSEDINSERFHYIDFDLSKTNTGITKIAVTLTEEKGLGFIKVPRLKARVESGNQVIEMLPSKFTNEKGIVILELYLRNGKAKVKSVWQGFSTGLDGLCNHFGVEVAENVTMPNENITSSITTLQMDNKVNSTTTTQTKNKAIPISEPRADVLPKTDLIKESVEMTPNSGQAQKINLQKVSGKINLSKGQKPILIDKTAEITATVSWSTGTDYDIYALILTKDGYQIDVAMFGAMGVPILQNYGNGAVEHMGDIGSSNTGFFSFFSSKNQKEESKTEILKIRLNDNIIAVVPVVYSAQSNGTGSFYRYRVSMEIDNHQGTTVTISSDNANNNELIYTCVPGLILNTPEGIVIEPLETYSIPGSEKRPAMLKNVNGKIDVIMDAGPVNNYK